VELYFRHFDNALPVGVINPTMTQALEVTLKSSIFDRERRLIINKDCIEFDNSRFNSKATAKLFKSEISGFRYGIKWINGYQFVIGRIYCIDVRSSDKRLLKIRLKSVYGVRKRQLTEKYGIIVNTLYDYFFDDISRDYLSQFAKQKNFEILSVTFTQTGIALYSNSAIIPWEDVGTRSYQTYYVLFCKSEPNKYRAFEYLYHWNTGVLYSVSREILKEKGYWSE
jgi:hypothetical protein